ncbi:hypothetical protein [Dehalobacter sp. TBBPA1]|uniref:hypothetical protein n=1 Tax=Dehalobacter sp. TBBPA1 TaxID=3235037 RepID=UPI0034A2FD65
MNWQKNKSLISHDQSASHSSASSGARIAERGICAMDGAIRRRAVLCLQTYPIE